METIFVGVGTLEDPFPEEKVPTRIKLFAGSCQQCGWAERVMDPTGIRLVLICTQCRNRIDTGLLSSSLKEITYVFWCTKSKFSSDELPPGSPVEKELVRILSEFEPMDQPPAWGILVIGGICQKADECQNFHCPFRKKRGKIRVNSGNVVPFRHLKTSPRSDPGNE